MISLIELPDYFHNGIDFWEIYSGDALIEDIERYNSKEEAEERIKELFKDNDIELLSEDNNKSLCL
jgi:hypothetical protein